MTDFELQIRTALAHMSADVSAAIQAKSESHSSAYARSVLAAGTRIVKLCKDEVRRRAGTARSRRRYGK